MLKSLVDKFNKSKVCTWTGSYRHADWERLIALRYIGAVRYLTDCPEQLKLKGL